MEAKAVNDEWSIDYPDLDDVARGGEGEFLSPFFHLTVPEGPRHCQHCRKINSCLKCSNCKVVFYCSKGCQKADWSKHKKPCRFVNPFVMDPLLSEYDHLKKPWRGQQYDYFADAKVKFLFWDAQETKDYCRVAHAMMDALVAIGTPTALKQALRFGIHLLYHNRGDCQGLRYEVPFLLIRLHMDQAAADFIKWYADYPATFTEDDPYEFYCGNIPYLHFWHTDRALAFVSPKPSIVNLFAADVLIKVKLLQYLQQKEAFYAVLIGCNRKCQLSVLAGQQDVLRHIYGYLLGDQLMHTAVRQPDSLLSTIEQVMDKAERQCNVRIWRAIANPQPLLAQVDPMEAMVGADYGTARNMRAALSRCLPAWQKTPGAVKFLVDYCMKKHGGLKYDCQLKR